MDENMVQEVEEQDTTVQNETDAGEMETVTNVTVECVDYTAILEEIKQELVDAPDYTETLASIKTDVKVMKTTLQDIYADVHLLMVFALLSFCWSCMRAWRKNVTREVK